MIKFFRNIRIKLFETGKSSRPTYAKTSAGRYIKCAIGEIILVVIGILIALQINTWNDQRKENIQERSHLARILFENKQDIETLTKSIFDLKKEIEIGESFFEAFKYELVSDSTLVYYVRPYFKDGSIDPIFGTSTSTFDVLSRNCNLKLIKNTDLREKIVKH